MSDEVKQLIFNLTSQQTQKKFQLKSKMEIYKIIRFYIHSKLMNKKIVQMEQEKIGIYSIC